MLKFSRILLVLVVCNTTRLAAQAPADISKQVQITVRVTYDNDRGLPSNVKVALQSAFGGTVETRTTDGYGTVTFSSVAPGRYRLVVSGYGISTTDSGDLDLSDGQPNVNEYIRVHRTEGVTPPGGESSVKDANVPGKAKSAFEKGMRELERKDWNAAKGKFEEALAIYPNYALAENGLGMAYLNLGQGEKAVETFQNALKIDENLPSANLYLGRFYYENHRYKEAEPYLLRSQPTDPNNAQILTALANCELKNGEPNEALVNARKVHLLKDHKQFAIVHLIAADVLTGRNQNNEAAQEYQAFLKEDPNSPLAPKVREALTKLAPTKQ